jgi:hypothetical protein
MKRAAILALLSIGLLGCPKPPPPKKTVASSGIAILTTLVDLGPNAVVTDSGLKYVDKVVGTGAQPQPFMRCVVHYRGLLTDGTVFDDSRKRGPRPFDFVIGQADVISGWDEGVMGMKTGGVRRLVIPPVLAYGTSGQPPRIPPNATLVFDIELLAVLQGVLPPPRPEKAVAPVQDQVCGGCFISIRPNQLSLLKGRDQLVTCWQCGRILHL